MKRSTIVSILCVWATFGAFAADAPKPAKKSKHVLMDYSMQGVMDSATAKAILEAGIPAKVWKLYPASKWGFVSMVDGGFTESKICVVAARVMLTPLTVSNRIVLQPEQQADVFDALPNASQEQCKQLAKDKLKQALEAVVSSLVKS